jgi:hypothetical protein
MSTPELNKAWCEMREDIKNPAFDSTNPHFKNKFASLKSVMAATIPVASSHGIAVYTELVTTDQGIGCYIHLCHVSGEEKRFGPYVNRPTKNDPQGEASASTYARRYALQAVFGVVGEEDDDGNAASDSAFKSKQAKTIARKALKGAAIDADDDLARKTWVALDTDQQAELWASYNKDDHTLIKESLAKTKEVAA